MKKAPGIDKLRAEAIKMISEYILESVTFLTSTSMKVGVALHTFKTAAITAINKNGKTTNFFKLQSNISDILSG